MSIDKKILRPTEFPGLIRVGREMDGGYVVPRSVVDSSSVLVSLGVNDDWSFEEGIRKLNPKTIIEAYDNSVGASVSKIGDQVFSEFNLGCSDHGFEGAKNWWKECVRKMENIQSVQRLFSSKQWRHALLQNVWIFSDELNITPAHIFEKLRAKDKTVSALLKWILNLQNML